jgi:aspartate/methionine/tyrosine aminotransferase
VTVNVPERFVPSAYPFERRTDLVELASRLPGGMVDLSIGTPCDAPPAKVVEALAHSGSERGYPPAVGSSELREAAAGFVERRFGVTVDPALGLGPCIGTKEFVTGLPHWLRLRSPERDTVLFPALSYPSYEMGAVLAGARGVRVPSRADGTLDLGAVASQDASRALCLFVNSPGNPAGQLEDLGECARWGRANGVPVVSDECYVDFTWAGGGQGHTILEHGLDGVIALYSLSKRSNLAGLRAGMFAGDEDLVEYLVALRRHAGFMLPGPVQHAAAVAFGDDEGVIAQRREYEERLSYLAGVLTKAGTPASVPDGSFYLWVGGPEWVASGTLEEETEAGQPPRGAGFALARHLAARAGALVSPGSAYGPGGADFVRIAVVQPMERLELVSDRLAGR